jgi:hypothetical protein
MAAMRREISRPSGFQREVRNVFRGMGGLSVEEEVRCDRSDYSIDMRVKGWIGLSAGEVEGKGEEGEWAVEVDGPSHFLRDHSAKGNTLLKHRHLRLLGYRLVSVPYWEWDALRRSGSERESYLRRKLLASKKPPLLSK